jgi:hypothetical protein
VHKIINILETVITYDYDFRVINSE